MMSNCAFWSESGELVALHGAVSASSGSPRTTFTAWAATRRLPPGCLVSLSAAFPILEAPAEGWCQVGGPSFTTVKKKGRASGADRAPVAVAAPALDEASGRLFPAESAHRQFVVKAQPTWVKRVALEREESPEGWLVAGDPPNSQYLLRFVPHRGRLPSEGWRNMVLWALQAHSGLRFRGVNALPTAEALEAAPAWEYRVEAGQGAQSAAGDVQLLPSRALLQKWSGLPDPWEATALLRWLRPGAAPTLPAPSSGEPRWADVLGRLPVADARLLVQNVLTTLPGGAAEAAVLFFDDVVVPSGGRTLVRHVPQPGLPLSLLSTLFGKRAWGEIERAKRALPPEGERRSRRSSALADLDLRLAEGRLVWSAEANELWQALYREPRHRDGEAELAQWRQHRRWLEVMTGDGRVAEALLRSLDVTDIALCLRNAPDAKWRRFVTARREAEIREEIAFCAQWEARGELTVEREIDAWRSWDERARALALEETGPKP